MGNKEAITGFCVNLLEISMCKASREQKEGTAWSPESLSVFHSSGRLFSEAQYNNSVYFQGMICGLQGIQNCPTERCISR